ncbi:MAG: nucleotidyltransferase domain-containing protein [Methanococci archaeon]|nr:nucleotidyltransferase domain-containing protein [Methanococci archaeon]
MNEEQLIKKFVHALKSKYKESDIDILVAEDVDFDYVIDLCTKLLLKYRVVINAVVESEEQFNKKINWSFHRNVLEEGRVLY